MPLLDNNRNRVSPWSGQGAVAQVVVFRRRTNLTLLRGNGRCPRHTLKNSAPLLTYPVFLFFFSFCLWIEERGRRGVQHSICFRGVSMHMSMMRNMMMREKSPKKKKMSFSKSSQRNRENKPGQLSLLCHPPTKFWMDIVTLTQRETENAVERRSSSSDSIPKLTPWTTIYKEKWPSLLEILFFSVGFKNRDAIWSRENWNEFCCCYHAVWKKF